MEGEGGSHVTIIHDAFDLTVLGAPDPGPRPLAPPDMGPHCAGTSLLKGSILFTGFRKDATTSSTDCSKHFETFANSDRFHSISNCPANK